MTDESILDGAGDTGAEQVGNPDETQGAQPGSQNEAGQEAQNAQTGAPEQYEFSAPEGEPLDQEMLSEFTEVAKGLNLSQENANKFFSLGLKLRDRWAQAAQQQFSAAVEKWASETKRDPEFGGAKFAEARQVANEAFQNPDITPPDLVETLKAYGLVNHPAVFRHFYRLGKQIREDKVLTGRPSQGEKNPAEILFPGMKG